MNSRNSHKINQKTLDLSSYKHFQKIDSLKDLKFFKSISNVKFLASDFLEVNVEKIIVLCQSMQFGQIPFISEKPYLADNGKLVYLFSDKMLAKTIFEKEQSSSVGRKIIDIFKNINNTLYAQEQCQCEDFIEFANFIINHENDLLHNLISGPELLKTFLQFAFILKNCLRARIFKSIFLHRLENVFNIKPGYKEVVFESYLIASNSGKFSKGTKEEIIQNLQNFLFLCTKDGLLIFPAKRTFDSRTKNEFNQSDEHFLFKIYSLQMKRDPLIKQISIELENQFHRQPEDKQLLFQLVKKNQESQQSILIKLKSEIIIAGPTFLFFEQLFNSVIQKYTKLYLEKPFLSGCEENLSKFQVGFIKKQLKFDLIYQISFVHKENLISRFIKSIDMMLIIYLVFERILLSLSEQNYLQNIMSYGQLKNKQHIEQELASDLYNFVRYYTERFTEFKRKYFALKVSE